MRKKNTYDSIVVRLGEYMVREGSRYRLFQINRLRESIEKTLSRHDLAGLVNTMGSRILIRNIDGDMVEKYVSTLSRVFGVSSVSPAISVKYDLNKILRVIGEMIALKKPRSIKIDVIGEHGFRDSLLIEKMIGDKLVKEYGLKINLSNPDQRLVIEVRRGSAFIMDEVIHGPGGLPYGAEGRLAVLFSGGVDSALATWFLLKRGVEPVIVHVDMGLYWSGKARERFYEALKLVREWVPWDSLKIYVVKNAYEIIVNSDLRVGLRGLLCKSTMYRIASLIADREDCRGIATGESIGQVASQTLDNLLLLSRTIDKPVYRPLAFMDKLEIIDIARKLGFDKLSRDVGACGLRPSYPETQGDEKDLEVIKNILDSNVERFNKLVDEAEVIVL